MERKGLVLVKVNGYADGFVVVLFLIVVLDDCLVK